MSSDVFLRLTAFGVGFGAFGLLQILLWASGGRGVLAALFHHPWLWVLYFLPALVVAEHVFNYLKRRLPPGRDTS